jgi:hypothetical protein
MLGHMNTTKSRKVLVPAPAAFALTVMTAGGRR